MKKIICILALVFAGNAHSAQILVNGGFETGDFTGWDVTDLGLDGNCPSMNRDWNVSAIDSTGCDLVGGPISGEFSAYNMLDGIGPLTYVLSQDFMINGSLVSADLSWIHKASWSLSGLDRVFSVDLLNANDGSLISNLFSESYNDSSNLVTSAPMIDALAALSGLEGQSLSLAFSIFIPEVWTGPAGFVLDDVVLDIVTEMNEPQPVSAPATMAFLALGLGALALRKRALA
jgi:hypothetical protein